MLNNEVEKLKQILRPFTTELAVTTNKEFSKLYNPNYELPKQMEQEIWVDINHECIEPNTYEISSWGHLRYKEDKELIKVNYKSDKNALRINLRKRKTNAKDKFIHTTISVSKLMEVFLPEKPNEKSTIKFIDNNRKNLYIKNLKWTYNKHQAVRQSGYWTKEKCVESANKCKSPSQWQIKDGGAYSAARNNGWFDECTKHMENRNETIKPPKYWYNEITCLNHIPDNIFTISSKRIDSIYNAARKNKFINAIKNKLNDNIIADAKKYKTKEEWKNKSKQAYSAAKRANIIYIATEHMLEPIIEPIIEVNREYQLLGQIINKINNTNGKGTKEYLLETNRLTKELKHITKEMRLKISKIKNNGKV